MRIGMVCYPTVGGSGIVATRLGQALAARGHQVHFVTYEKPFALDLDQDGVHFHPVRITQYELFKYPDYGLSLAAKLAQVAREYQLDLLHVHYAIPHATSACLARTLMGSNSPAIVTTLHGTDISLIGRDPAFFDLVQHSINASDAVTAVSHSLKSQTIATLKIQRKVAVIPNFVVPPIETPSPRPTFLPPDERVLIHVSNFRPIKRVGDAIHIFAQVAKRLSAHLVLVGDGSSRESVQELAIQLGVSNAVHFLGTCANVHALLSHSDLFVLPSQQESFGLAALEAMSHGVPVIGTQSGGLPEVVRDGLDGMLYPVGDTQAMAEGALELLSNRSRYQTMRMSARRRAHESFGLEAIVQEYEACYYQATMAARRSRTAQRT